MKLNVATSIAHLKSWKRKTMSKGIHYSCKIQLCDTPLIIQFSLRFRFIADCYVSGSLHILLYSSMKTSLTSLLYLFISPLLLKRCSYWGHPIGEQMPAMRMKLPFGQWFKGNSGFCPTLSLNSTARFLFVGS